MNKDCGKSGCLVLRVSDCIYVASGIFIAMYLHQFYNLIFNLLIVNVQRSRVITVLFLCTQEKSSAWDRGSKWTLFKGKVLYSV